MKNLKHFVMLLFMSFALQVTAQHPGIFKIKVCYKDTSRPKHHIMGDPASNDNTDVKIEGTGYLWRSRYIISAYHVLASLPQESIMDDSCRFIVTDYRGNEFSVNFIGGETLFDIAVLELDKPLDDYKSFSVLNGSLNEDPYVKVEGYKRGSTSLLPVETKVVEKDICMPGCFGSHKLAMSTQKGFSPGYSGSPVVLDQNTLVGMVTGTCRKDKKGYFIGEDVVKEVVSQIIKYGKMRRIFTGTVWEQKQNGRGVILKDTLYEGGLISPYIGQRIETLDGIPINDLIDLRSAFEKLRPDSDSKIRLGFESGQSVDLKIGTLEPRHLELIVDYYKEKTNNESIINNDIKVVSTTQIRGGISCNDVYDLGLILKTFSTTNIKLTFLYKSNKPVRVTMPQWLFN